MANLKYITLFSLCVSASLLGQVQASKRGGDKFVLGNTGPGCGPKFIFKSGTRRHKEWFILNECQNTHKHHSHDPHHHHEPHVLNFPIHLPPPQHHVHQVPPMIVPQHHFAQPPLPHHHHQHPQHLFGGDLQHHPASHLSTGLQHSPSGLRSKHPGAYGMKPHRAALLAHEDDNNLDNGEFDKLMNEDQRDYSVPSATLKQITDWNTFHHHNMMSMPASHRQRSAPRYMGMPSASASPAWRKSQSKRFANFHDRHF